MRALSLGGTMEGIQFGGYSKEGKLVASGKLPTIFSRFRSEPATYTGPQEILFFDLAPPASLIAEPEKPAPPAPVGKAVIPAGADQILLLFAPAGSSPDGAKYEVLAMDDTSAKFPMGSYLFMNFSKRKLVGAVGKTKFEVAPGASAFANPGMPDGGGLNVWLFAQGKLERPLLQEAWYYYPKARVIVLLRDGPGDPPTLLLSSISEFDPSAARPE